MMCVPVNFNTTIYTNDATPDFMYTSTGLMLFIQCRYARLYECEYAYDAFAWVIIL